MRVPITPIKVNDVECSEVEVNVAISNSVAIRAVPVDAEGNTHIAGTISVVGDDRYEDISTFMSSVAALVEDLLKTRGV